jgi:hypothetical protein
MMNTTLEQAKLALREHQEENAILKEMLASRGIQFQNELKNRKAGLAMKAQGSLYRSSPPISGPGAYNPIMPGHSSSSGFPPVPQLPDRSYARQDSFSAASASGATHHGHSPADPGVFELNIKQETTGVSSMPGIFERDPQLQIDFILA